MQRMLLERIKYCFLFLAHSRSPSPSLSLSPLTHALALKHLAPRFTHPLTPRSLSCSLTRYLSLSLAISLSLSPSLFLSLFFSLSPPLHACSIFLAFHSRFHPLLLALSPTRSLSFSSHVSLSLSLFHSHSRLFPHSISLAHSQKYMCSIIPANSHKRENKIAPKDQA